MPRKNIIAFCVFFLLVFAGQVPVALTLMGGSESSKNLESIWVPCGMVVSIVAGVAAIGFFLSAAKNLNEKWLEKADLALKAAGALLAIIISFWFGLLQHQQEEQKKEAQNLQTGKAEKERQRNENAIRFRELLPHFAATDTYLRLQAITNVGELISEQDSYALTATLALFTAAFHDTNIELRNAALRFLPNGIGEVTEKTSFTDAVIALAQKKNGEPNWEYDHKMYLALVSIREITSSADNNQKANNLVTQLTAKQIQPAFDAAKAVAAASEGSNSATENSAKLDKLAPAIVYSMARDGNVPGLFGQSSGGVSAEARQIQQAIQNTSPDAVASAIKNLPSDVARKLSARVYFQIADDTQRAQAKTAQSALWTAGYICPGIQNVKGRGYIPDTLEVRYFVLESKGEAEKILQVLKDNGAKDGRVSYVIPSASDLRISPDIKSHFEVWAGRSSF